MNKSYYLIKQELPYIKPNIIKIYDECNITHLKKLINTLIGEIHVYHYNQENNSREDLTSSFGKPNFNIYDYPFEKIKVATYKYTSSESSNKYIKTFTMEKLNNKVSKNFYMHNKVYFLNQTLWSMSLSSTIFFSELDKHQLNNKYGSEYEKYIANKYTKNNFKVILNGIEKSYNDGGIDVIAENENTIILVQCKNWSLSNEYKINQKDIRAFIGDCYLYMTKNTLFNKSIAFHFIVSHNNILTKSAEIFLKQNTFIKFKCIPFEKEATPST